MTLPSDAHGEFLVDREASSVYLEFRDGTPLAIAVSLVQIAVAVEADVSSADPLEADKSDGQKALDRAFGAAQSVAFGFVRWLRVDAGQFWIGESHAAPSVVGTADLLDAELGGRVRNIGLQQGLVVMSGVSEGAALSRSAFDGVIARVSADATPSLADETLADARSTLRPSGGSFPTELRRAVLPAAVAVEIKVQEVLMAAASAEQASLLDLMLRSHEDVPTSPRFLLKQGAEVLLGKSLRADGGPAFWRRVDALFNLRNDVAHRAVNPSLAGARDAVACAVEVFEWLNATSRGSDGRTSSDPDDDAS